MCCNVDDRLTGFLIKELGLIPKKTLLIRWHQQIIPQWSSQNVAAYGRLTVVKRCSVSQCSPSDQNSWVSIFFRYHFVHNWEYFPEAQFQRCSCSFLCKWTNARQSRTKTPIFALPAVGSPPSRITSQPQISKCHQKYQNATTDIQMTPKNSNGTKNN